jgi:fluoride ion exporter CrcB/FEX
MYAAFPLDELSINTVSTFSIGYMHKLTGNTKAFIEANCNNLSFG